MAAGLHLQVPCSAHRRLQLRRPRCISISAVAAQSPRCRLQPVRQTLSTRRSSVIASAADAAASDAEYIYSPLPADSAAAELFSALQTSNSDSDRSTDSSNGSIDEAATQGTNQKGPRVPQRWRIVLACAVAFVLSNIDKVNMSVAVIPMSENLGWSALDRGLVNSAFFYGYTLTQVPAGWMSTKIGGAKVLLAGVLVWSLGTLLAPPAAKMGIVMLCASRVLVGLGEGLAPSSATNILANIIPERERARAVTVVFGSLDVGSAVGLVVCGPLIRAAGWPTVFYLFGALGLVWCLAWTLLDPERGDPEVMPKEPAPTPVSSPAGAADSKQNKVPWLKFLQTRGIIALIIAHFCFNYGYYTLLAWLPSYFELALGLNVESSSLLTLIPYLAMIASTPFVGPVADWLVSSKGWSITAVRKLCQGVAFAGPLVCMLACASLTPAAGAVTQLTTALLVGIFSASFACGAWSRAGLYCVPQDINPRYAGAILGVSNTAGALPGVIGVSAVGLLLDRTNSWAMSLFLPIGACYLFGLVTFTLLANSERREFSD